MVENKALSCFFWEDFKSFTAKRYDRHMEVVLTKGEMYKLLNALGIIES